MKAVQENKKDILHNRYSISENQKDIQNNKEEIKELKKNCIPYIVFESTITKYDRLIHRLIIVLALVIALLFISNAVWIYAWNTWDNDATTVINKDGISNFIGGEGEIRN